MNNVARISRIVQETPSIKTFYFEKELQGNAGQFVMAWLPGIDEKPFSIAVFGKESAISVQKKGKFTSRLFELKEGDKLGIRGPFGKGFDFSGIKKAVIVAGGCGTAAVALLPIALQKSGVKFSTISGAKTKNELFFQEKFKLSEFIACTDDGSFGKKGFVTEALEEALQKEKPDCVFACGPEVMLVKVFEICESYSTECQLSLERFMKCGFGVCAQCVIDEWLVCKDGPVFNSGMLRKLSEFGKFARLKSGEKVSLQEYYNWRQE